MRCFVDCQEAEEAGEERHGEVDGINVGRAISDDRYEHHPDRVVFRVRTLSDLGAKLPSAEVPNQFAAESTFRSEDCVDDCAERGLKRALFLAHEERRGCDTALLNKE